MTASKPLMLSEFEKRFRKILKRIYRTLQQHEIREEVRPTWRNPLNGDFYFTESESSGSA